MPRSRPPRLLPALLLLLHAHLRAARAQQSALSCRDHPAYHAALRPVLVRSFALLPRAAHRVAVYKPRVRGFDYTPVASLRSGAPVSTLLHGLDWFHASLGAAGDDLARVYVQRAATAYVLVGATVAVYKAHPEVVARLPGWTSHGWAHLGRPSQLMAWGVHQRHVWLMQEFVQVFSRPTEGGQVVLPSKHWVKRNWRAPWRTDAHLQFRIGERNGRSSPPVGKFKGMHIRPNERCPDALHEAWYVKDPNPADDDTRGVRFSSWHPAWDPCFWCAYDHEHGSSAKHLMGYEPKFTLTARKNNREDESDAGFKAFVFQSGDYMVYFNIHAQTSVMRRMREQYHTIAIAVTHVRTKALMLELSHKADYGFLGARGKRVGEVIALSKRDADMQQAQQQSKDVRRRFRSVNVINVDRPDPRLDYRRHMLLGGYEKWVTMPMCADGPPFGEVVVDLKTPCTGIRSARRLGEKVGLGGPTWRNVGTSRSIQFKRMQLSARNCRFKNGAADAGAAGERSGGYFYTDALGTTLLDGPGRRAVRQFIRPGFEMTLSGIYGVAELGLGLHMPGYPDGHFRDYGFGLDPDVN